MEATPRGSSRPSCAGRGRRRTKPGDLRARFRKESPAKGRAGAPGAVCGLSILLRDTGNGDRHSGRSPRVSRASAFMHPPWGTSRGETPSPQPPGAFLRRGAGGGARGTHRALLRGRGRLGVLGVQRRAHADEGEPELAVLAEGLAAGEPQAVPLLPHCRRQEICCKGAAVGVGAQRGLLSRHHPHLCSSPCATVPPPGPGHGDNWGITGTGEGRAGEQSWYDPPEAAERTGQPQSLNSSATCHPLVSPSPSNPPGQSHPTPSPIPLPPPPPAPQPLCPALGLLPLGSGDLYLP